MDAIILPLKRRERLIRNNPKIHPDPVGEEILNRKTKNRQITKALKATRRRREGQVCKQYELKIDSSHLNNSTRQQFLLLFLEAKWLHNHLLAGGDIFKADYKTKRVQVKVKDRYETRLITHLSSQMRQELLDRTKDNIVGLSRLKEKGYRVGRLRFKRQVNSIPLKQYANTWKIIDRHHIKIQGVKKPVRVRGLNQIPKNAELTSAQLLRKHGDLYLHVVTYQTKPAQKPRSEERKPDVGIDFGVKNQLTISNGVRINYEVPLTGRMVGLCRQLSRRQKHGRNWHKTIVKLEKEHDKAVNIKHDVANKISYALMTHYGTVCTQNDNMQSWQRLWGRRMLDTRIGGITRVLKQRARTLSVVDRWYASTKKCSQCGNLKDEMPLEARIYCCHKCGIGIDRDLNAAINILQEGRRVLGTPTESRSAPADTKTTAELMAYLRGIPRVRASLVEEAGSPQAMSTSQREAHDFSHG